MVYQKVFVSIQKWDLQEQQAAVKGRSQPGIEMWWSTAEHQVSKEMKTENW